MKLRLVLILGAILAVGTTKGEPLNNSDVSTTLQVDAVKGETTTLQAYYHMINLLDHRDEMNEAARRYGQSASQEPIKDYYYQPPKYIEKNENDVLDINAAGGYSPENQLYPTKAPDVSPLRSILLEILNFITQNPSIFQSIIPNNDGTAELKPWQKYSYLGHTSQSPNVQKIAQQPESLRFKPNNYSKGQVDGGNALVYNRKESGRPSSTQKQTVSRNNAKMERYTGRSVPSRGRQGVKKYQKDTLYETSKFSPNKRPQGVSRAGKTNKYTGLSERAFYPDDPGDFFPMSNNDDDGKPMRIDMSFVVKPSCLELNVYPIAMKDDCGKISACNPPPSKSQADDNLDIQNDVDYAEMASTPMSVIVPSSDDDNGGACKPPLKINVYNSPNLVSTYEKKYNLATKYAVSDEFGDTDNNLLFKDKLNCATKNKPSDNLDEDLKLVLNKLLSETVARGKTEGAVYSKNDMIKKAVDLLLNLFEDKTILKEFVKSQDIDRTSGGNSQIHN